MRNRHPFPVLLSLISAVLPVAALARDPVPTADNPMGPPPTPPSSQRELRWDAPNEIGFWARALVPPGSIVPAGARAAASGGFRLNWSLCESDGTLGCDRIRMSTGPQFRSVSDAPTADGGIGPAVGLAFVQDAELRARPGVVLRAAAEIGNQIGVADQLATGSTGTVAKARAGATFDLRTLGAGVPLRVGVSLAVARDFGPTSEDTPSARCEGGIEIRYADYAPLSVTAPCDVGQRDSWIGFGVRGKF